MFVIDKDHAINPAMVVGMTIGSFPYPPPVPPDLLSTKPREEHIPKGTRWVVTWYGQRGVNLYQHYCKDEADARAIFTRYVAETMPKP